MFSEFPRVTEDLCTLQKIPLFLFRVKTPDDNNEYFLLGGIGQDMLDDHIAQRNRPSPIQWSLEVNISSCSDPFSINMDDCQILPIGHQYKMIGWDTELLTSSYKGVAFLALNKGKRVGGEFVVLLNYTKVLLVFRSAEMRWMRVKETSEASCRDVIAFKGRFYATFLNGDISVYDPYTLIGTPLMPSQPLNLRGSCHLVRSGDDDELFLVEHEAEPEVDGLYFDCFACRVSRLDEEASKWVEVTDIGDRVFFIGHYGNVSCSAKELPSGCGVSGNSIVFTKEPFCATYAYKYGVDTGDEEDELNYWRALNKNRVGILIISSVVALRVEL